MFTVFLCASIVLASWLLALAVDEWLGDPRDEFYEDQYFDWFSDERKEEQ
jgi:hypothetical protein